MRSPPSPSLQHLILHLGYERSHSTALPSALLPAHVAGQNGKIKDEPCLKGLPVLALCLLSACSSAVLFREGSARWEE